MWGDQLDTLIPPTATVGHQTLPEFDGAGYSASLLTNQRDARHAGELMAQGEGTQDSVMTDLSGSQGSVLSLCAYEARSNAFRAILENAAGNDGGEIGLICTTDNHSKLEPELGEL